MDEAIKENIGLEINNISRFFEIDSGELKVLNNINLDVRPGEFVSIVGKSGCGKSTLLKLIVGLDKSTQGEIRIGSRLVDKPSIECGMVFQEARLYPWLTVEKNIEFGISGKVDNEKKERIAEYIALVGLTGFEKAYRPNCLAECSKGQVLPEL